MKSVSNINLNILMEKLYIEGAVNRIYEESSDFDWVGGIGVTDLSFKNQELWIDLSMVGNDDKNMVMNYLRTNYDGSQTKRRVNERKFRDEKYDDGCD